jgi:hypothetical protein
MQGDDSSNSGRRSGVSDLVSYRIFPQYPVYRDRYFTMYSGSVSTSSPSIYYTNPSTYAGVEVNNLTSSFTAPFSTYIVTLSFREHNFYVPSDKLMNLTVVVAEQNPSSIVFSLISNNINNLRSLRISYALLHS